MHRLHYSLYAVLDARQRLHYSLHAVLDAMHRLHYSLYAILDAMLWFHYSLYAVLDAMLRGIGFISVSVTVAVRATRDIFTGTSLKSQ